MHVMLKWNEKKTFSEYYFNFETFHNKWKCDDAPEGVNLNIPFRSVVFPELSKPTIKQWEGSFDKLVILSTETGMVSVFTKPANYSRGATISNIYGNKSD